MKIFKPGLWSLILITVAMLCLTSAITHRWWPEKTTGNGALVVSMNGESLPAPEPVVARAKSTEAWANSGTWEFMSSKLADTMITYSDERVAENVANGIPGNGLDGQIRFSQTKDDWYYYLGVPASRWNDMGLIDVEFKMFDGSIIHNQYFIRRTPNGIPGLAYIESGRTFRNFKSMFFGSSDITVTHIVAGPPIVHHFHNHIGEK